MLPSQHWSNHHTPSNSCMIEGHQIHNWPFTFPSSSYTTTSMVSKHSELGVQDLPSRGPRPSTCPSKSIIAQHSRAVYGTAHRGSHSPLLHIKLHMRCCELAAHASTHRQSEGQPKLASTALLAVHCTAVRGRYTAKSGLVHTLWEHTYSHLPFYSNSRHSRQARHGMTMKLRFHICMWVPICRSFTTPSGQI